MKAEGGRLKKANSMSTEGFTELFKRHKGNPIISPGDIPYQANSVFNAGAAKSGDETVLLLRIEDRRGMSHLTAARSKDGLNNWHIDTKPTFIPRPDIYPEEIWGIEDPRITYLEERSQWAVTYTSFSKAGSLVSLAVTSDFQVFERIGTVMPPENKDAALFPVRFDDRWAMIHRPVASFPYIGAHIWISFSPDLKHWGDHRLLIEAREGGWWDAGKVGISTPPLKTEQGWLILYHGIRKTVSGAIYRLGLALLDLNNPCKVTHRSDEWVFTPEETYERVGDVGNVIFPTGWIQNENDIRLYYGGADTCIAVATTKTSELIDWLSKHSS